MMSHFVIKLKKNQDPSLFIKRAAEVVKEGGIIAYLTDTVYGMGVDPLNIRAVNEVFQLKNRSLDQGLPILVSDLEEAKKIGIFSEYEIKLAKKFWPGQLTIVVPLRSSENSSENSEENIILNKIITGGDDHGL